MSLYWIGVMVGVVGVAVGTWVAIGYSEWRGDK